MIFSDLVNKYNGYNLCFGFSQSTKLSVSVLYIIGICENVCVLCAVFYGFTLTIKLIKISTYSPRSSPVHRH